MPDRWSATAYACLMVALYVTESSQVELTVQDHVRVDRLTSAGAERHGDLIPPGTTTLHLAEGRYVFRTTRDAQLRVSDPAVVRLAAVVNPNDKDIWPDSHIAQGPLTARGDAAPDRVPALSVILT